jgi:hypothetical protein
MTAFLVVGGIAGLIVATIGRVSGAKYGATVFGALAAIGTFLGGLVWGALVA